MKKTKKWIEKNRRGRVASKKWTVREMDYENEAEEKTAGMKIYLQKIEKKTKLDWATFFEHYWWLGWNLEMKFFNYLTCLTHHLYFIFNS